MPAEVARLLTQDRATFRLAHLLLKLANALRAFRHLAHRELVEHYFGKGITAYAEGDHAHVAIRIFK